MKNSTENSKRKHLTDEQKKIITELILEGNKSQDEIASIAKTNQSQVSRYKRKMGLSKKSKYTLKETLGKAEIYKPDVFFFKVEPKYRLSLAENLLRHFGDTPEDYGIIHIQHTVAPSGLLVYTLDRNLEYRINNDEYINSLSESDSNY